MAKTVTESKTKAATKAANTKTVRSKKDAADKPKREPTAYQIFCKENMKKWNEENPGRAKEAMTHIAELWKNAPENPNRGQEPKPRKPREKKAKESKNAKEPKEKKPRASKKPAVKEAEAEMEDGEQADEGNISPDEDE